jgi:hypothetical protein
VLADSGEGTFEVERPPPDNSGPAFAAVTAGVIRRTSVFTPGFTFCLGNCSAPHKQ